MASLTQATRRLASSYCITPRIRPSVNHTRTLQTSSTRPSKKDDLMDKDSMDIQPTEHSKSGGDQQAAQGDQAFDPETTSPEQQNEKEARVNPDGHSSNPYEVSPANPDVSKPRAETEGGAERSPAEHQGKRSQTTSSRNNSPNEAGGGKSG